MSYSPTLDAMRTEDLAWRLQQINAHFGISLTLNDLSVEGYDSCGILPAIVTAVVAGKTYRAEKSGSSSFNVFRIEPDGSQRLIWSF